MMKLLLIFTMMKCLLKSVEALLGNNIYNALVSTIFTEHFEHKS